MLKACNIVDTKNWLNIDSVVNHDLCSQCGACEAMCPHDNIVIERDEHFRYFPRAVDEAPCVNSCKQLCVDICSGVHEDTSLWKNLQWAPDNYQEYTSGKVESVWIGYSTDKEIRSRGTSGGLVTGLLVYLLEKKLIDGVLLVGTKTKNDIKHDIMIATTRAEIEQAWGSKYYPMPIGAKFRDLMEKDKRYAVVLLGCHMRSLRLMEQKYSRLKKNIIMRIGLICGYCSGKKGLMDQASDWGFDYEEVENAHELHYRDGKWPGMVRITSELKSRFRSIYEFLPRIPLTTNHRCLVCSDLMNETADIAAGDAWLRELTQKKDEGWSVIAVRNLAAEQLISRAVADGALYLERSDTEAFIRSQEKPMRYKKHALKVRFWFTKHILRQPLPSYDFTRMNDGFPINGWNILGNILLLSTQKMFFKNNRFRKYFYRYVPQKWIDSYVKFIFLLIAHEGKNSFVKTLFKKDSVALNCDA